MKSRSSQRELCLDFSMGPTSSVITKLISIFLGELNMGQKRVTGNKGARAAFSESEREKAIDICEELDAKGYSQHKIAKELERRGMGVSQPTVCGYLQKVRERYINNQMMTRAMLVAQKQAQYAQVRQEAYEAWEWSKGQVTQELMEELKEMLSKDGLEALPDAVEVALRKSPANQFLLTIKATLDKECELLGLNAEQPIQKHAHLVAQTGNDVASWDDFARSIGAHDLVVGGHQVPLPPMVESKPVEIESNSEEANEDEQGTAGPDLTS